MSYCRFSTDNFRCDLYAYGSHDGYHLHVAGNRVVWDPPPSPYRPESLQLPTEEFNRINREYHQTLLKAPREFIDLEGAGGHHVFATLRELRDSIADHLQRGFQAPAWLLPSIDEEIREEETE